MAKESDVLGEAWSWDGLSESIWTVAPEASLYPPTDQPLEVG